MGQAELTNSPLRCRSIDTLWAWIGCYMELAEINGRRFNRWRSHELHGCGGVGDMSTRNFFVGVMAVVNMAFVGLSAEVAGTSLVTMVVVVAMSSAGDDCISRCVRAFQESAGMYRQKVKELEQRQDDNECLQCFLQDMQSYRTSCQFCSQVLKSINLQENVDVNVAQTISWLK